MWIQNRFNLTFVAMLLSLLILAGCGNPIGKTKRGRQHRKPGGNQGGQVEQPDNGDYGSDEQGDGGSGGNSGDSGDGGGNDHNNANDGDGQDNDGATNASGSTSGGTSGSTGATGGQLDYDGESVASLLRSMPKTHPRLMADDARLEELGRARKGDKVLNKLIRDSINKGNKYLKASPIKYQTSGPNMLRMAHEALKRSYALGFAYRATKDQRYVKKLEENLVNICGFRDWAPDHFLATAEFCHAVAIGYDWGFAGLSENAKKKIREGLLRNGLNPGLRDMRKKPEVSWVKTEYNWNFVCNGGLVIGALAIAENEPKVAEEIIEFARHNMVKTFKTYAPDGAWPEGPGYWSYATHYAVYTLAAMQTALGADFGLSQLDGLGETGQFAVAMTSQNGNLPAFADVEGNASRKGIPVLFWLADYYDMPELATEELEYLKSGPSTIQHLIWYPSPASLSGNRPRPELDTYFDGMVQLMFLRGGYEKDDIYMSFKAGFNKVHHGHLDLGNFEFEALGVRWARDLGSDSYSLPGYWESRPGGRRWDYYRIGSFSHNVPTFGGKQQDLMATSKFTKTKLGVDEPAGVIDIDGAYPSTVSAMQRGVKLTSDRGAALVQDEYTLKTSTDVLWGMTTDAQITLEGSRARLKKDGKELVVQILEPAGAKFYKENCPTKSGQKSNKGYSRLLMKTSAKAGSHRIAVELMPVWSGKGATGPSSVKSLKSW
jgi:hypothetical protein